jgi:hypothetical protein
MPDAYSVPNISDIASRLAADLQELKNLKIDKPEITEAIELKEYLLKELKKYLEKNDKALKH